MKRSISINRQVLKTKKRMAMLLSAAIAVSFGAICALSFGWSRSTVDVNALPAVSEVM